MIKKINHNNIIVSKKLWRLFQESYKVEADLLEVVDFPPLRREVEDFIASNNIFYVYLKDDYICGAIELFISGNVIHIQSLVVSPDYFRKKIGFSLVNFVFSLVGYSFVTVETGVDNIPAVSLYKKVGFLELEQFDTDHGVRKIKFKKYL